MSVLFGLGKRKGRKREIVVYNERRSVCWREEVGREDRKRRGKKI